MRKDRALDLEMFGISITSEVIGEVRPYTPESLNQYPFKEGQKYEPSYIPGNGVLLLNQELTMHYKEADPLDYLRKEMEKQGLRQCDISHCIGDRFMTSKIFSGKRKLNTKQIRALALEFGFSPAGLLGLEEF